MFNEKGWSGALAEPVLQELSKKVLEICTNTPEKTSHSVYQLLLVISQKSTQRYNTIKQFQLRASLSKFMIFSRIFMTCYDQNSHCFKSLTKLTRPEAEDMVSLIKVTIKPLFDAMKRKSTFFRYNLIGKIH